METRTAGFASIGLHNFAFTHVMFLAMAMSAISGSCQAQVTSLGQAPPIPQPAFEVASIRLSPPDAGYTSISDYGTNRFTAKNLSLGLLISIAFGFDSNRISGQSDQLDFQFYDISAKAEGDAGLTREQMQPLLRNLLEHRFRLTTHRESKTVSGYALVVAKGGPKLQANKGAPQLAYIFADGLRIQNQSVKSLALTLATPAGRPVINKTGIEGVFDFNLKYAPNNVLSHSTDSTDTLPDIFSAVQEQLGLKLVPQKVPIETLVIDHVDKIPIAN